MKSKYDVYLTPAQIGKLAEYISQNIASHPNTFKNLNKPNITIEDWECLLAANINADNSLPNYETIQSNHCEILENLIKYYNEIYDLYYGLKYTDPKN